MSWEGRTVTTLGKDSEKVREILETVERERVKFVNLQFTGIMGIVKPVTMPAHELEDTLDHGKWFDGSSSEGFARIHESDMYLEPDLATFGVIPFGENGMITARVTCNVFTPDGEPVSYTHLRAHETRHD